MLYGMSQWTLIPLHQVLISRLSAPSFTLFAMPYLKTRGKHSSIRFPQSRTWPGPHVLWLPAKPLHFLRAARYNLWLFTMSYVYIYSKPYCIPAGFVLNYLSYTIVENSLTFFRRRQQFISRIRYYSICRRGSNAATRTGLRAEEGW